MQPIRLLSSVARASAGLSAAVLAAACSAGPMQPPPLHTSSIDAAGAAPSLSASNARTPYRLEVLQPLGGAETAGISDNNRDWISGFGLLTDNATMRAALWYPADPPKDLGTLGGANSAVEFPNHAYDRVAGIAQTGTPDPLGEQFSCSYPSGGGFLPYTGQECRGFVWRAGHMNDLGTLGGNNSFAAGANVLGDVVGWAETPVHDSTCVAPQVLQFKGVYWGHAGIRRVLAPLAGDEDSAATSIDDRGNAVGISGICQNAVGARSAEHAVIWRDSRDPMDIGNLGGSAWNTPESINDRGQVVGFSDLPGDDNGANFNAHAFLWTQEQHIKDLGTLGSDVISFAYGVNERGQIVGQSCGAGCAGSRAFLYQNGRMSDLNALIGTASASYYLVFANDINDEGQITGLAVDNATGTAVGFRLVPTGSPIGSAAASIQPAASVHATRFHVGPFGRMIPTLH